MAVSVTLVIFFIGVAIVAVTIMGIAATSKRVRQSRLLHRQRFESGASRIPIDVEMDAPDVNQPRDQSQGGYFDIPTRATVGEHPPIYVVEDMEHPPPIYEAVYSVPERPTVQELTRLRTCLETLKRQPPTVDTTSYDVAIRQASISSLQSWIMKLETLRQSLPRESSFARSTIRMFTSSSDSDSPTEEVSVARIRPSAGLHRLGMRQRETGWVGVGQPREVRPPLDPIENTLSLYIPDEESEEEERRFDILRRQAMERRMRAMAV
ncbi:hypothetical protein VHEMI03028 [[Torrubiella] hemipterigena]|uniref:Uncharacterized protein n=1 Tax=[Torrubiella] hemipterigena TaxID=1531966 RepID=A0A0A1T9M8_9HYPO|nr:hypothetical protein VHEMI03028 [[Torrubiella] hemipterigena]